MSNPHPTNRVALGTVQFGLAYGIANQAGKIHTEEAGRVLQTARESGIDTLDTAIAYGDSESVLGSLPLAGFNVISKLPEMPEGIVDVQDWVRSQCKSSLKRLGIPRLRGLLLHRPEQLLSHNGEALHQALLAVRDEGLVEKIGISVYSPCELQAFENRMTFDLVQAPFNPVDRRLAESGWMDRLHERGTEIHVRSIFMQGLLLMPSQSRPTKFSRWAPIWKAWDLWLEQTGQTPLEACLHFALSYPQINRVIVGVDNEQHLRQITQMPSNLCDIPPHSVSCSDIELLNPSLWSRL
ncbi:aldo/keto reductase [Pseudomonas sichuanensis]|uniref:aldo/keto reductase n=1 Tax=Pseudomonas sichuanensis TaxID=2213015 RepID=UPI00215E0918|nr:aldo/keto reductase [Pseudomonas sichuanensis]MDZ4017830.1 hypothetical protein [Pseudomonas sichuanensis]UVL90708.1 aldo/keto reductase [Pseudomonas sichuanensis]